MLDYAIVKLERAIAPPSGTEPWYRYVIANGTTSIEGLRAGTEGEVREHALRCAERLNGRHRSPLRW